LAEYCRSTGRNAAFAGVRTSVSSREAKERTA